MDVELSSFAVKHSLSLVGYTGQLVKRKLIGMHAKCGTRRFIL